MMMKKTFLFLMLFVMAALISCTEKNAQVGQSDHDILTYRRLDPQKTTLIVSRSGNIDIEKFSQVFEEQNPDVQVVCLDITGGSANVRPMIDWVKNGLAPDLMFISAGCVTDEQTKAYMTNLSTNPVIGQYEAEALNKIALDAEIYWLPGPSDVESMIYNRTLFDQYGWQIPTSFDEFVALCDQITADTNGEIEPWNPNAKYANSYNSVVQAFFYEQLFGGAQNRTWLDSVMAGKDLDTLTTHMKPLYDGIQTLLDHGILREDQFTYSATERGKQFESGKIAMINMPARDYDNDMYDFDFMPYPSSMGNDGYIIAMNSCVLGVPKKEHTAAEQDAMNRYLAFFSSPEGQEIFIGEGLQLSSVKNVPMKTDTLLAALQPAIDEGRMFSRIDFFNKEGKLNLDTWEYSKAMAAGEMTEAECLAAIDADPYTPYAEIKDTDLVVAAAEKDFSILETSFLIADMYRETSGAQIGLIENNVAYRGNLMRIFAGDLTADAVTFLTPRSLANDSKLTKVSMTGQQLLDALNDPMGNGESADCIYAFSGLKCTVAPWNAQGSRYLSVTLADGAPIEPDQLYTVAFWTGTVSDQYITEVLDTYEGSWQELMTASLKAHTPISPVADDRITLSWK